MEKLTTGMRWLLIGLLLIEAMIMFGAVPDAYVDEFEMRIQLVICLLLALMISLAIIVIHDQNNRKAVVPIFIVCVATYLQIFYCSMFYKWSAVCLTLPIVQLILGYCIFALSKNITALFIGCSNLMLSTIWANQFWGFLWLNNKSNDLETYAVSSLYALIGALIVFTLSAIMIMKFNIKTLEYEL